MCLIIHREKDTIVNREALDNACQSNPDGFALSYLDAFGDLTVVKGLNSYSSVPLVEELEKTNTEFVLHLRFTTHGETNLQNCHGYAVHDFVLFHNGIFHLRTDSNPSRSDTWHYCRMLERLLPKHPSNKEIQCAMDELDGISWGSKVVIMTASGDVLMHNAHLGTEKEGVWYSNAQNFWGYTNIQHFQKGTKKKRKRGKITWTESAVKEVKRKTGKTRTGEHGQVIEETKVIHKIDNVFSSNISEFEDIIEEYGNRVTYSSEGVYVGTELLPYELFSVEEFDGEKLLFEKPELRQLLMADLQDANIDVEAIEADENFADLSEGFTGGD